MTIDTAEAIMLYLPRRDKGFYVHHDSGSPRAKEARTVLALGVRSPRTEIGSRGRRIECGAGG
jgi:hypothetical protein